jgi:hypothetical protein
MLAHAAYLHTLQVPEKSKRVFNYHKATVHSVVELMAGDAFVSLLGTNHTARQRFRFLLLLNIFKVERATPSPVYNFKNTHAF